MADLSIEGLTRIGYEAQRTYLFTIPGIDAVARLEPWEDVPDEHPAHIAFTQAVLAALAEAAGSPQALGALNSREAWSRINAADYDVTPEIGDFERAAQTVAACAVAGVRGREVEPLLRLLQLPVERRAECMDAIRATLGGRADDR